MSRICVKNIGKNTNENDLKELFSRRGEVTDVKVMKKQDGKSRNFAFVGFRSEQQAIDAQKYFNNTFIGLSKISIEIAKKIKDKQLEEQKEKHSKNSLEKLQMIKNQKEIQEIPVEKTSNKADKPAVVGKNKSEFLDLALGKNKQLSWANDSNNIPVDALPMTGNMKPIKPQDDDSEDSEDDSEYNMMPSLEKKEAEDSDEDSDAESDENKPKKEVKTMSAFEYLKSKVIKQMDEDSSDESDDENNKKPTKTTKENKPIKRNLLLEQAGLTEMESDEEAQESDSSDEEISHKQQKKPKQTKKQTNEQPEDVEEQFDGQEEVKEDIEFEEDEEDAIRLFIKNIPYSCTEDEVKELFSTYGQVNEVHIPLDNQRRGKGIAFVSFMFPDQARKAMEALDGSSFQGRLLYISIAEKQLKKETTDAFLGYEGKHLSSFQIKKEEERRNQLHKKEGWNASYVRSDTVVESLANRFGVTESDILDTSMKGGDLAVRLAIAETNVIQENKEFFLSHGVDIDVLESTNSSNKAFQRSTTTLLVKNLPPDTSIDELESMFARFGVLGSFLVPPTKTLALVDFVEPSEARAALKGLAYRRYKNSPLFLEWAPLNVIQTKKTTANTKTTSTKPSKSDTNPSSSNNNYSTQENHEDNLQEYSSLFIKNLNFITTEEGLVQHIHNLGIQGLRTVVIQKKSKGQVLLSQGYGFAEFASSSQAQDAMNKLNNSVLDSHSLQVKPSDKRLTIVPAKSSNNKDSKLTNKIIVRNLAFQANKNDLMNLFSVFGSIKRIRLPKKMTGQTRGFAFIDFSTNQEALNAMNSLKNTHLYGRHLVLEWANDDEEEDNQGMEIADLPSKHVQALRKRAQDDQMAIAITNKRGKKSKAGDDMEGMGDVNELM